MTHQEARAKKQSLVRLICVLCLLLILPLVVVASDSVAYQAEEGADTSVSITITATELLTSSGGGGGGGWGWDGGGPPVPEPLELEMDLWGTVTSVNLTEEGVVTETIEATSADAVLTILFFQGTRVLDCAGNPPYQIEVKPVTPPDSPPDTYVIGLGYDLKPCCTFDPLIQVIIHYDPEALSDGVDQQDLFIAHYDAGRQEWVVLPSVVDTGAHTVTASVSHSAIFALLAPAPDLPLTPTPAPSSALGTGTWIGIGMGILGLLGLTVGLTMRRRRVTSRN